MTEQEELNEILSTLFEGLLIQAKATGLILKTILTDAMSKDAALIILRDAQSSAESIAYSALGEPLAQTWKMMADDISTL